MDGITHINIYSKGQTALGQALSNFADTPIETMDGKFRSIEGYWYWLGTNHPNKDILRLEYGAAAKSFGREYRSQDWNDDPTFKLKIYSAMLNKMIQHKDILADFLANQLPFRHYYVFKSKVVEPEEGKWITDMWNFFREQLCTSLNSNTKKPQNQVTQIIR